MIVIGIAVSGFAYRLSSSLCITTGLFILERGVVGGMVALQITVEANSFVHIP